MKQGYMKITKQAFYFSGGFSNRNQYREEKNGSWVYYRLIY